MASGVAFLQACYSLLVSSAETAPTGAIVGAEPNLRPRPLPFRSDTIPLDEALLTPKAHVQTPKGQERGGDRMERV